MSLSYVNKYKCYGCLCKCELFTKYNNLPPCGCVYNDGSKADWVELEED